MKGLLYKDFKLVSASLLKGILGMVIFGYIASVTMLGITEGNFQFDFVGEEFNMMAAKFMVVLLAATGMTIALACTKVMEYDKKSEWYKVLYSAPVPLWIEIMSRYLLLIIANTITALVTFLIEPVIFTAGKCGYGTEQMKMAVYAWLVGLIVIFARLPIDIIFPAKVGTAISIGSSSVLMVALLIWISIVEYADIVVNQIALWIKTIYGHGVLLGVILALLSYGISYGVKRGRRWA